MVWLISQGMVIKGLNRMVKVGDGRIKSRRSAVLLVQLFPSG